MTHDDADRAAHEIIDFKLNQLKEEHEKLVADTEKTIQNGISSKIEKLNDKIVQILVEQGVLKTMISDKAGKYGAIYGFLAVLIAEIFRFLGGWILKGAGVTGGKTP